MGGVASEATRPPPDGVAPIEMPADEHAQPGAAAAAALLVDLEDDLIEGDGVIAAHDPLLFVTEDLLQIVRADGDEGTGRIRRRPAKRAVVVGDEALGQVAIGGRHRANARDPQLVDQAALQGAVGALAAPARLGGVPENMLDAEAASARPTRVGLVRSGAAPLVGV